MADPLLVTISFSHFCEKARWALDRAGIAYRESGHLPFFHIPAVRRAGGRRSTPILVTDEGVLDDSSDIVAWADRKRPEARLFGKTEEERREVTRLVTRFDADLGPHTRRWTYFHILPDRALTMRLFDAQRDTPAYERVAIRGFFPVGRAIMRRVMRIHAAGAARSAEKIDAVFDEVGRTLSDGRRYLVGDTPTAADLTFAALAAPALLPDEYASRYPLRGVMPASAAERLEAWREHPAGLFARRMVREHRSG